MTKLYRTFKDSADGYISDNIIHKVEIREAIKGFAKFLDSFQVADDKLQIAALQQARKIDREYISLLIDAAGIEKAHEIALSVNKRHAHYSQWQDRQNRRGGLNWPIVGNWLNKRHTLYAWITWQFKKRSKASGLGMTTPTQELPQNMREDISKANDNRKD